MTNKVWQDDNNFQFEDRWGSINVDKVPGDDRVRIQMECGSGYDQQQTDIMMTKEEAIAMCNFIMGQFK